MRQEAAVKIKLIGFIAGTVMLIIVVILALYLSISISRPLHELCDGVKQMGEGNFTMNISEHGAVEIKELSGSFNHLGGQLTDYMKKLEEEVSTRQAMETEIHVAKKIQQSMLPHEFPNEKEFQLYASLSPAREVSGDFYDFFHLDKNTLALVIADVSGKGIPAALFMAAALTTLRNTCYHYREKPEEAMREANNRLAKNNESCTFVTVFLAYYRIATGEMVYANAGHNDALQIKSDGSVKPIRRFNDIALGAMPGSTYQSGRFTLAPGEKTVLYTDGVSEAVSPDKEFFGTGRLEEFLKENSRLNPREMAEKLNKALGDFQGDSQSDDITLVILQRNE